MAKKTITITEHISELIYDIQNKTYLTGKSRSDGNNHEAVANMQANDDDEDANQIMRSIGNAFSILKTKLADFIEDNGTTANNTLISGEGKLTLVVLMPSNFNQAVNDTIASAVHQYLVNTAVGDWFAITNKNDAGDYIKEAEINLGTIREAINKRVRPVRAEVNEEQA